MGSAATARKNKYNAKKYDQIRFVVPKGRKNIIDAYAAERGMSTNAFLTRLVDFEIGDWCPPESDEDEQE